MIDPIQQANEILKATGRNEAGVMFSSMLVTIYLPIAKVYDEEEAARRACSLLMEWIKNMDKKT